MRPACDFLLVLSLSGFWYQGYARLMSWEMFPLSLYSERVCMRWNYLILQWLYNLSAKPYKPGVFCEWRFLTTDSIYLKVIIQLRICLGIFFFFDWALESCSVQFSHSVVYDSLWPHPARQAYLSITNSRSLLKLMSIMWVMPSNHLILCHPLLFPPSIFPSIRLFSNESVLHIR